MVQTRARSVGAFYLIYSQVAAVIGAFALAAFLSELVELNWRGVLAELIGFWGLYVRPSVDWLLSHTIILLVKWVFHFELFVPLILKDYLGVGLVLTASIFRATRANILYFWQFVRATLVVTLGWPVFLLVFLWEVAWFVFVWRIGSYRYASRLREWALVSLLAISPLIYLALLLAANYLLLKPGT
jgi:hypothetical protein